MMQGYEDIIRELYQVGCLEKAFGSWPGASGAESPWEPPKRIRVCWQLIGTDYYLCLNRYQVPGREGSGPAMTWSKRIPKVMLSATGMSHQYYGYRGCSFEDILDNVPQGIREQLLFHLDLFCGQSMSSEKK